MRQIPPTTRPSGQVYSDPNGGYRFTGPAGWVLQGQQGGWLFKRPGHETILTVSSHQYTSVAVVLDEVTDQQDASSGTFLQARKERYGTNGILATFSGTLRNQAVILSTLTLVSPTGGGGVTLTTIAPLAEHTSDLTQTLKAMAAGVVFSKPQASPVALQWQQRLNGRQLLYLYTGNGFSEKQSFDFCTNGTFGYTTDASASSSNASDSFSAATQDGNSGTWRVALEGNQTVLTLTYRNGRMARLIIASTTGGNGILLNGKRYFVRASQNCR